MVTSRSDPTLILWDIDHTLVNIGGLSRVIYERAYFEVTGRGLRKLADMTGRTERAILVDTLALNGVPVDEEVIEAFYAALACTARDLREDIARRGSALPGAMSAISVLAEGRCVQSVVTGNIRPIAEIKLNAFDLAEHIDFDIGGYGSDGYERAALIRLAWGLANDKAGYPIPDKRVFVIGDTPHDIKAAREVGVGSVGVASGGSTVDALQAAHADVVLPDLRDREALRDAVLDRIA